MNLNITFTDSKHEYYSDYYRPHLEILNCTFEPWNILKAMGISSFKLLSLSEYWDMFRAKYCPTVITQYGTVGIKNGMPDERNIAEKLCDMISGIFVYQRECRRNGRAVWNGFSYFDWGAGRKFTNMDDIHRYERETGKQLVGWRDVEVERAKVRRFKEEDQINKISGKLKEVFGGIQKGKSYIRENRENRRKIMRELNG